MELCYFLVEKAPYFPVWAGLWSALVTGLEAMGSHTGSSGGQDTFLGKAFLGCPEKVTLLLAMGRELNLLSSRARGTLGV